MNNYTPSPRGVLALLVPPPNQTPNATDDRYHLPYFDSDPTAPRLTRTSHSHKRRRRNKNNHTTAQEDTETPRDTTTQVVDNQKLYHPNQGEFTLVYFFQMNWCRNSQRLTMVLANFMHALALSKNEQEEHSMVVPCQLLCVPNDILDLSCQEGRRGVLEEASILSHLLSETGFWCLGYNHINRLALIR